MIESVTYLTSHCDVCKKAPKACQPTRQKQIEMLKESGWLVCGDLCFCPDCVRVHETIEQALLDNDGSVQVELLPSK